MIVLWWRTAPHTLCQTSSGPHDYVPEQLWSIGLIDNGNYMAGPFEGQRIKGDRIPANGRAAKRYPTHAVAGELAAGATWLVEKLSPDAKY
jgi:hypothetical protein